MSTISLSSRQRRDGLESEDSSSSMPPLDAMWDSLHVASSSSRPRHGRPTSSYEALRPNHEQERKRRWPPLPRYAFKEPAAREDSAATCSEGQPDMHASSRKKERSANAPRSDDPAPPGSVPAVSAPPLLPTAAPQHAPSMPSTTAPLGPFVVAGPWATAMHSHVPLMATGHLPPVGMPTQVLTHSLLPTTSPPAIPFVMYNSPQPLVGVVGAGSTQGPLPPQGEPTGALDKVDQSFTADHCLQYLERPAFASSLLWDLLAELLEEEELPDVLQELRVEQQLCAGWFASDPEYQAVCCVVDDLIDSTVSPVVPGVVSEVIDELHRQCVSSPRAQQKDALLSTALEVVDEMVQEIMEEEVNGVLEAEHLESCAAGLVKELVREVAEDSYHEAVLAARAHRSEQAASFVSEYLVEQLLFEEALDLCAEDQAAAPLTREAISGHIVDDVIFTSLLDILSEEMGP